MHKNHKTHQFVLLLPEHLKTKRLLRERIKELSSLFVISLFRPRANHVRTAISN